MHFGYPIMPRSVRHSHAFHLNASVYNSEASHSMYEQIVCQNYPIGPFLNVQLSLRYTRPRRPFEKHRLAQLSYLGNHCS